MGSGLPCISFRLCLAITANLTEYVYQSPFICRHQSLVKLRAYIVLRVILEAASTFGLLIYFWRMNPI